MSSEPVIQAMSHVPRVPRGAFLSLAGPELGAEVERGLKLPGLAALVLFTDAEGRRLALLPTGPGFAEAGPEAVAGREIAGLRPLCALFAEDAARIAGVAAPVRSGEEVEGDAGTLRERERYVAACEERLAELTHKLAEQQALVEHRTHLLDVREAALRGGAPGTAS